MFGCPLEHGAYVVDLGRDQIDIPLARDTDSRAHARTISELDQPVGLESPQVILRARGSQVFETELADRLEHPEALGTVGFGAAANETLVEERRERVEVRTTDRVGRLESAAAAEDGEPGE